MNRHNPRIMNSFNTSLLVVLSALLIFATSCSKKAEDQMPPMTEESTELGSSNRNALPSVGGNDSCMSFPSAPSVCVWTLTTDAVVYGTLTGIRLIRYPAVHRYRSSALTEVTQEVVNSCSGFVIPAMELDIDVEEVVHGNVGRSITVRIGKSQLSLFNPQPHWDEDGNIKWMVNGSRPGGELAVGQKIGVGMYYISEHNLWTLSGEPLFTTEPSSDGTNRITFQHIENSCAEPPPKDIEGVTVEQFISVLSNCSQEQIDAASARKAERRIVPETPPEWYMTAECFTIPASTNECEADSDCPDENLCINNACVQQ